MKNYISINISYIRHRERLERKDIASANGLTTSAIGTYETGKSVPNIYFIQKFCKDYNINIDDFINKDLSKLKHAEQSSDMVKAPHHIKDKKTIAMYEGIIEHYREMLNLKTQELEAKEARIKTIERIHEVEKNMERLKALNNQSAPNKELLDKLEHLKDIEQDMEFLKKMVMLHSTYIATDQDHILLKHKEKEKEKSEGE